MDSKNRKNQQTGDFASITLIDAARLLGLDAATLKLWSDIGLLSTSISPDGKRLFRWAEILTFLPVHNRITEYAEQPKDQPAADISTIRDREGFARLTARAMSALAEESVLKIRLLEGVAYA